MRAIILAAGEGRRLRPLTERVPKPMLPIAGRPLLVHLIELLRAHGVDEIGINLHHRPDTITTALGDGRGFGVRITYSIEERLLGSAGGVKRMERFLRDEPFFVLYGDVLTDLNLTAMHAFHRDRRAALTIALHQPEQLDGCGVVRVDEGDRVLDFIEKPAPGQELSSWANAGIYVIEPAVLRHIPKNTPFDFGRDLFPLLLAREIAVFGYAAEALVLDIGTPVALRRAQALAMATSVAATKAA